jgi:uncharacterized membrane protein YdfJ with MMPL/SSD domain
MTSNATPRAPVLADGARRLPLTVRIASWSARHRWPVIGLWLAATVGLYLGNAALGGQRFLSAQDSQALIGDSAQGDAVFTDTGAAGASQSFDVVVSNGGASLDTASGHAAVAALVADLSSAQVAVGGQSVPVFASVVDPFAAAAANPSMVGLVISADSSSVIVNATITGSGSDLDTKVQVARSTIDAFRAGHPGLTVLSLNDTEINADLAAYGESTAWLLLLVTLPLTLLILVVAFRALVAAAVPLTLGLTSIVGAMGIVGAYSRLAAPVSPFAAEFVVLIGLAVAIDYSLFVISRFRAERSEGRTRLEAIELASATSGRAVFFSGVAVAISMASMFLLDEPLVTSFALGSIAAVSVSIVGTMTFIPAVISVLDKRLDRGGIPIPSPAQRWVAGLWPRLVLTATKHAPAVAVTTAALLILAASPAVGIKLGYTSGDLSSMPGDVEGVRAARLMAQEWPQGSNLTLDVIATNAGSERAKAAISRLETEAASVAGVTGPAREYFSEDGSVAKISFTLARTAADPANAQIVREFRSSLVPTAFGDAPDSAVYVAGDAAYALDYSSFYAAKTILVAAFVLGLSFLLLLVAFHSIAIPIKAILLNLLSLAAAFGVMVMVFHGSSSEIDASNPVMMFAILFGLSMDYHVFILSRVKEARDCGLSSADAVLDGISRTAGIVTSAAAIMVCVFAGFATIGIAAIQQFGLGMAVAIFVDATLVRSLLLPATMRLLGEWNWWLPSCLRWLPTIEVEAIADAGIGASASMGTAADQP